MRYEQVGERWIIRIMDNGAAALVDKARNVVWGGGVPGWVTMRDGERMTIAHLPGWDGPATARPMRSMTCPDTASVQSSS